MQWGEHSSSMNKAEPLAPILLGLDASHHAVCRALTDALTTNGIQPLVHSDGFLYYIEFTIYAASWKQPGRYQIIVSVNDG